MSRRRAKSLKLDQVIDLLLNDTISSGSSDDESASQSPKKRDMKSTVKDEETKPKESSKIVEENKISPEKLNVKESSSDEDDNEDEEMPLWQLAKKKTPEVSQAKTSEAIKVENRKSSSEEGDDTDEDDDDLPLWELANKTKTQMKKELSDEKSKRNDVTLSEMGAKKQQPLKPTLNHLNNKTEKDTNESSISTLKQPESKYKIKNKKIASSLKGIYNFLDAQSFRYKANAFDSDMSSSCSESNENSDFFDANDLKENRLGIAGDEMKLSKKFVAQSPAIKMDCMTNNKYYISAKNLKRKKIF